MIHRTNKARCDCSVSAQEIKDINPKNFLKNITFEIAFYQTITHSNFQVVKCYKLIFIFTKIIKNFGEILMTFILLIFIILMIIYYVKGNQYIMAFINLVLKLSDLSQNQDSNLKRNKSIKKATKLKQIKSMNKEKFKPKIKKEKLKKTFSQAPPKKNKCQEKNPELTNNIINNNIVLNLKVNTKDSSHNIFAPKNKKNSKSIKIKKNNDNKFLSENGLKKALNNSSEISFINKKDKTNNSNKIRY